MILISMFSTYEQSFWFYRAHHDISDQLSNDAWSFNHTQQSERYFLFSCHLIITWKSVFAASMLIMIHILWLLEISENWFYVFCEYEKLQSWNDAEEKVIFASSVWMQFLMRNFLQLCHEMLLRDSDTHIWFWENLDFTNCWNETDFVSTKCFCWQMQKLVCISCMNKMNFKQTQHWFHK